MSPNTALQRTRLRAPLSFRTLGPSLAAVVSTLALASVTTFGSIVTRPAEQPVRNTVTIRDDAMYEFVFRHYGSSQSAGENTVPGLFVHSKKTDVWLEVVAVSTRGGRFGRSWSDDPEEQKKLKGVSVVWDFRDLVSRPFVSLPLKTSGSIAFPDQIEDDRERDQYRLRFMSKGGIASAETVLLVDKADLKAAFAVEGKAK